MNKTRFFKYISIAMILIGLATMISLHQGAEGSKETMNSPIFLAGLMMCVLQMIAGIIGAMSYSPRASIIAGVLHACMLIVYTGMSVLEEGLLSFQPGLFILAFVFTFSAIRWQDNQVPAPYETFDF